MGFLCHSFVYLLGKRLSVCLNLRKICIWFVRWWERFFFSSQFTMQESQVCYMSQCYIHRHCISIASSLFVDGTAVSGYMILCCDTSLIGFCHTCFCCPSKKWWNAFQMAISRWYVATSIPVLTLKARTTMLHLSTLNIVAGLLQHGPITFFFHGWEAKYWDCGTTRWVAFAA